ncbi:MAG TPA: hypothetical protein VN428_26145 [Bryobacteraceae bacterium]|nr:hypothetical protein [Bryobacteraceae bacterium]
MCDYSLHAVPNRLAVEGEQLVTHRFPTSSIGLASPVDLIRNKPPVPEGDRTWWQVLRSWLNPPPLRTEKVPAVCIPPGARLRMVTVPRDLQQELGVGPEEEVTFVQLSASAYRYRDGIRFRNGREILLQYLDEGLTVEVLSLASAESVEAPVEHARLMEEVEEDIRAHFR